MADPKLRLMPMRLVKAANRGNCKGVAAWLDDNKQQHEVDELWDIPDSIGRATLLMLVSGLGHASLVDLLLERGARIDLQDSFGFTALMYAATQGQRSAAQDDGHFLSKSIAGRGRACACARHLSL